jgi:hypothetical protein
MNKEERVSEHLLWKTWGEFYGYPTCCVLSFCKDTSKEYFFEAKSVCRDTGYVPCADCFVKIKTMNRESLNNFIGRDVFTDYTTKKYIELTYSEIFLTIVCNNGMSIKEIENYRDCLRDKNKGVR